MYMYMYMYMSTCHVVVVMLLLLLCMYPPTHALLAVSFSLVSEPLSSQLYAVAEERPGLFNA